MKHTPGDEDGKIGKANAALIAAAPDLLAALVEMEQEKSDYMRLNNLGDPAGEHGAPVKHD